MFNERGIRLTNGAVDFPVAKVPLPAEIEACGAAVVNDAGERLLLDGHFYYSGEIPRVTPFERGRVRSSFPAAVQMRRGWAWQPRLLMDERMVVARLRGLGLIVFSACSHAGVVNVCTHVRELFPDLPIHCLMGGLHLGGVMEGIIPDTVEALRPFRSAHHRRPLHRLAGLACARQRF